VEPRGAYLYDLLGEGPVPYAGAMELMADVAAARSQGAIPDTVILCEHAPTLSLGRAANESELTLAPEAYAELGWDVVRSGRGGRSTWHGPGQLVAYPVLDLREHGRDIRAYAHALERVAVGALATLGVEAEAREGSEFVGVWVADRKVASLGVKVESWIATHGLALNVDCDTGAFARFDACGLGGAQFTTVAAELGRPVAMESARDAVVEALEGVFALDLTRLPVGAP